ncbi:MAG: CHRD domain-containing protein [Pseudomonadota bacterium]
MKYLLQFMTLAMSLSTVNGEAAIINLAASLNTVSEPFEIQPSSGFGSAAMTLDTETGEFAWVIGFEQLSGPATLAHFHAAPDGSSGPVVLNLDTAPGVDLSGIGSEQGIFSGSTILAGNQVDELLDGLWYINIHTALNPAGEIRGQVYRGEFVPSAVPLPAPLALLTSGALALGIAGRRRSAPPVRPGTV